ncbi:MAG: hypothetical protein JO144_03760, partial [Actinobacteria bacterium]|nr:hypothetical protein [Actinomycetota bacterium]
MYRTRSRARRQARSRSLPLAVLAALTAVACLLSLSTPAASRPAGAATAGKPPVYAYYYLWWSANHWKSALGPNYPLTASPLPLPATLDSTGCGTTTRYAGNTLTDVPARIYSQDDPGFLEADVRQAAAAGLSGFAVNWIGTG